jgi:hypothetical protein
MTEFGTARPDLAETRGTYGNDSVQIGWAGWLVFASFMTFLAGTFQAIQGLVAISDDGNVVARGVGVLLAGLSAIANMAFIGAYPVWSIIVIVVDVLVIYALTVHGGELRSSTR